MPEVLTAGQLARRYGLTVSWIKAQCKAGTLPHLDAGSRLLFNPVAVAEVLSRLAAEFPPAQQREVARV